MNGEIHPIKDAFSKYLTNWYSRVFVTTKALEEFVARGSERSMLFAADRMIDAAEDMLKSYQRNNNSATPNAGALLPVVIVAMSKDYVPTTGDWGGRQVGRQLIRLDDQPGGSVYGYRQAMGDVRAQVVIFAAEAPTARSLAMQFSQYIGEIGNRRFEADFQWYGYTVKMPVMLETPDTLFQAVDAGVPNITVLAADITLKCVFPYFDAPKAGEPNDGLPNTPPGYPVIGTIVTTNPRAKVESQADATGTAFGSPGEFDEPAP